MPVRSSSGDEGMKLTLISDDVACVTSILKVNWKEVNLGFSNSELVDLAVSMGASNRSKLLYSITGRLINSNWSPILKVGRVHCGRVKAANSFKLGEIIVIIVVLTPIS